MREEMSTERLELGEREIEDEVEVGKKMSCF